MDKSSALTYLTTNLFLTTLIASILVFIALEISTDPNYAFGYYGVIAIILSFIMAIPIGLFFIPFGLLILKSDLAQTKKRIFTFILGAVLIFLFSSLLIGYFNSANLEFFRVAFLIDIPYFSISAILAAFLPLPTEEP